MDFQSVGTTDQYPGRYRHDYVVFLVGADGRSPREIAKAAGLSHSKVYDAMNGDCKKIDTLDRLAKVFGVELKNFFDFNRKKFHRSGLLGGAAGR